MSKTFLNNCCHNIICEDEVNRGIRKKSFFLGSGIWLKILKKFHFMAETYFFLKKLNFWAYFGHFQLKKHHFKGILLPFLASADFLRKSRPCTRGRVAGQVNQAGLAAGVQIDGGSQTGLYEQEPGP